MIRKLICSAVVLSCILTLCGCSEHRDEKILLADSLSLARPDSAMAIMDSIELTKNRFFRSELMYYELIRAKVQNRAYVDFTTDSVMLEVADYYDHHGTANDRMLAHYLLGCTYRDLKEAPMSLQCYYDAVEAADTTSSDCDYQTLMSIWGQIANIHDSQCMPMEELDAWKQYRKYALLNNDTLNYIAGIEMCVSAYELLGDTVNLLQTTEKASKLFEKYGYKNRAAIAYATAIYVYLNRHNYDKAKKLITRYETESGFFDKEGNAIKGREHFYKAKSIYYLDLDILDSAQIYINRLLNSRFSADAYSLMMILHSKLGNVDSVRKYTRMLAIDLNESVTKRTMESMRQVKGMYDYSRNQRIADDKETETQRYRLTLMLLSAFVTIVAVVLYLFFYRYRTKKRNQLLQLNQTYAYEHTLLKNLQDEIKSMDDSFISLKNQKDNEITELQQRISLLNERYALLTQKEKIDLLHCCPVLNMLRNNLDPRMESRRILNKDWDELFSLFYKTYPSLQLKISDSFLCKQEIQVTILSKLNFRVNEIATLLNTTSQRIANVKLNANKKMFGESTARNFVKNLSKV